MLRAAIGLRLSAWDCSRSLKVLQKNNVRKQYFVHANLGALSALPYVPPSEELVQGAVKRASRVSSNKTIRNEAQKARNLCARQLDLLTKELAGPLGKILKGFPSVERLHPFEQALLLLTLGPTRYERHIAGVNLLRKSLLEVGKSYAGQAAKAQNKAEAYAIQQAGFASLQSVFAKGANAIEQLKEVAKELRRLPTVEVETPTVALVGAPNVGKSSLVQSLSSGLPEICDYPFTTRTVKMGHFFVQGRRHQVTDTPGLLDRADEDRNAMERLTLACLQHLPTAALFVMDLTGECGTSVDKQWHIRADLKARFPHKAWLDVLSKADLLEDVFAAAEQQLSQTAHVDGRIQSHADGQLPEAYQPERSTGLHHRGQESMPADALKGSLQCDSVSGRSRGDGKQTVWDAASVAAALPHAMRVSSVTSAGLSDLKEGMLSMLAPQKQAQTDVLPLPVACR